LQILYWFEHWGYLGHASLPNRNNRRILKPVGLMKKHLLHAWLDAMVILASAEKIT